MESIQTFFSIKSIFFTVLGYQMSYLEFFGTLLNLLSVYLVTRNNILTWPVGNLAVVLFGILFYQIQLYSDLVEQGYFLVTGFYGWWIWLRFRQPDRPDAPRELPITSQTRGENRLTWAIILAGTAAMGHFMGGIHLRLPDLFPEPASLPYLDAFTTVMSFAANLLMAHKKMDCWALWILVDIIGIGLYYSKGVVFISLLYAIFLGLAVKGLLNWRRLAGEVPTRP